MSAGLFGDPPDGVLLASAAPDGLMLVDADGIIRSANVQACALTGFEPSQLLGMNVDELVPTAARPDHEALRAGYMQSPTVRGIGEQSLPLRLQRRDGSELAVDISLSPVGADGPPGSVVVAVRDATDRAAHRDLLTGLAAARQHLLDAVAPTVVTEQLCDLVAQLGDCDLVEIAEPDTVAALRTSDGNSGLVELATAELDGRQMGPTVIAPLVVGTVIERFLVAARNQGRRGFFSFELAAIRAVAAELSVVRGLDQARRDRRRALLSDDRERIAHGLHDLVIQHLFATGMRLQASLGQPELMPDRIGEAIDTLDETITVIRDTIFKLTKPPDALDEELRELVDRYRSASGAAIDLTVAGELGRIPADPADQILAVVSELLSNAERHAQARYITVIIDVRDDEVRVAVYDDGTGRSARHTDGLGLKNLTQRAESRGGTLTMTPRVDGGLVVCWQVPFVS